jgi:hypothetical protein
MFRRTKEHPGPPDTPFEHGPNCMVLRADPTVVIPWSEVETRHWVRTCQCSEEHWRAPAPARVRLDPLDPKTSRHLPQCEFVGTTDPAILRALLKITPKDGYAWVECGGCQAGWQVADFAEEHVG